MQDIYVVFRNGDIRGGTRDAVHAADHAIEVHAWAQSIVQPRCAVSSTSGGHTAARAEHGAMTFSKDIDAASPKLWQAASAGTVYKDVEVFFYRALGGADVTQAGNRRVNYLKVRLKNAVVSEVSIDHRAGLPSEVFDLSYSAVQWIYNEAPLDGAAAGALNVSAMWNLATNEVGFA
jgi:type VI secretion system secreted protein Hcp